MNGQELGLPWYGQTPLGAQGRAEGLLLEQQVTDYGEKAEPAEAEVLAGPEAEAVVAEPLAAPDQAEAVDATEEPGRLEKLWNGIRRNKVAVTAGAITVASLAANPLGDTIKTVAETAKYVGPGMLAAEAAWIGGAAMMLAAIGKKIWNPLKIRSRFSEIPQAAAESNLFKAGLAINTTAALAEFAIPTAAVTANMPVQSWGVLSFAALDLMATVVLRRVIWRGMHKNDDKA